LITAARKLVTSSWSEIGGLAVTVNRRQRVTPPKHAISATCRADRRRDPTPNNSQSIFNLAASRIAVLGRPATLFCGLIRNRLNSSVVHGIGYLTHEIAKPGEHRIVHAHMRPDERHW
jgi:hypothetical protein